MVGGAGNEYPTKRGLLLSEKEWKTFATAVESGTIESLMMKMTHWKAFKIERIV